MTSEPYRYTGRSERLKRAMREACRLSAVIKTFERGLQIELSDGRVCTVIDELWRPRNDVMAVAIQWARRQGAASVVIDDENNRRTHA